MARYTGAKLRITRRLGDLPGLTSKKGKLTQRPGQHGATQKKLTQYAIRLEEKQKLRFNYGVSEKQLMNYVRQAKKIKGATGSILLQLLEMRLDNIVFRLGMAPTIAAARQMVSHKHIIINNSVVSIPSYQCKPGDVLGVKDSSASKKLVNQNLELPTLLNIPQNLDFDKKALTAKVLGTIDREWIALKLNELFVIEYYSRKI
jgi:small subunit ribosomal protein S4|tara:strand:+ start:13469 stop:14077 length:609 start_codon:yes stop_codon:yes gene_type:complete